MPKPFVDIQSAKIVDVGETQDEDKAYICRRDKTIQLPQTQHMVL